MTKQTAKKLVKDTFEKPFQKERFVNLMINFLNFERKPFTYKGNTISKAFQDFIKTCERIGQYKDQDEKIIDILIVCLKKQSSLERARAAQRNFIGRYLKGSRGNVFKDGALVAFVSPDKTDWRFSFVKIDYSFDEKGKVKDILTPARRYSFLVGENEKSHTAQACLSPLLEGDNKNPSLTTLEEAFSIEKVTREFFEKYRKLFWILKEALDKIITEDKKIKADFESKKVRSSDFAKKLLGQIVFLYFLQKKGWFGVKRGEAWGTGSKHFLRELFDRRDQIYKSFDSLHDKRSSSPPDKKDSLGKEQKSYPSDKRGQNTLALNFFNNILEPLFYEALAREHTEDYYSRFDCRIPFLNGGLFEPLGGYDWVNTDILLPDNLFSNQNQTKEGDTGDGILDIFDRYNFTVNEDEPLEKEVAVDPEMLGKVFENLLEVRDRKSKGTYYTPREIVHYMCQESLINYLCSALSSPADINFSFDNKQESPPDKDKDTKTFPTDKKQGSYLPDKGGQGGSKNPPPTKSDISAFIKISDSSIEHDTIYQDQQNFQTSLSDNKAISKAKGRYSQSPTPKSIIQNAFLIDKALAEIRVCDPAVGSGAFPVGMMNEIVRARLALTPFIEHGALLSNKEDYKSFEKGGSFPHEKGPSDKGTGAFPLDKGSQARIPYRFKRHTIEHCLYGVDIDPSAIEIAKLRLWLSLVVDEEDRSTVQPLPNLDYKIVCGNSLLGLKKDDGFGTRDAFYELHLKELYKKKSLYFNETSPRKKQQYKQAIDQLIDKIYSGAIKAENGSSKNQKIFDFEIHFSEVFQEKKGFDVVIANPPYNDSEEMTKYQTDLRKSISKNYTMTKGNWPIYIAFFEKSFNINNKSGTVAFITPDKWIAKPFGYEFRKQSLHKMYIILNAGRKIFLDVKVDAIVSLFSKYHSKKLKVFNFDNKEISFKSEIDKKLIKEPFALDFLFSNHIQFLSKINNSIEKSTQKINCENACSTSDAYKLQTFIRDFSSKKVTSKKYLKVINTGTIGKYYSKWGKQKMKYLGKKYLYPFVNKVDFINNFKGSYFNKSIQKKIIIKGLTLLDSCLDIEGNIIPGKSTLIVIDNNIKNLKILLALLNSKIASFYIKETHPASSYNQGINFTKEMINNFPIPKISQNESKILILLVDQIIKITKSKDYLQNLEKQTKVQEYEKQIDQLVYKLYNLTPKEIKIVENS